MPLLVLVCIIAGIAILVSCKKEASLPTISTTELTNPTTNSVTSGGLISKDGGAAVTARGVCWSTTSNPDLGGSFTTDGTGAGTFISNITGLTPNTLYHVRAYATNKAGTAYGNDLSFTTIAIVLPSLTTTDVTTITGTTAISGGNITSDGNESITARGVCWATTTAPTISNSLTTDDTGTGSFVSNLSGLTPGVTYYIRAYATNSVGTAYGNEITFTTVATGPSAPTIGTATAGNAQATVTFTAPANNGGSAITGYTVSSIPGNITGTGSASPITVTGLTNGTAYTFTVIATNAKGNSSPSAASNSVTPSTIPGAPTIGTATGGNVQATVAFTAPANNGGSAITGYTVKSNPGNFTGTGTTSPITVTGLTNGTAYTFTVVATNANGPGLPSAASNSVTPASVPGAPTIGTATKGNAQAIVTFTAPSNTGGLPITGYTVTSTPGNITGTGPASPITVTGLTNGTAYTFTVVATNANGPSIPSAASNSVIPSTVPGAPTIGAATEGDAQASVTFTAPVSTGGSAITGYTVTSNPGNVTGTGSTSPITVTGLTNGTLYTFTVVAMNANGSSIPSAASNSVRPHTATTIYDIEGNVYNIVTIGTQVWMADNLKTATFANGVPIPTTAALTTDLTGITSPVYQWADHDPSMVDNSATYGRLYTWYAAIDNRNVCPTGWHVPTDAEFSALELSLVSNAGGKLKEAGTVHWNAPNTGADNSTGFTMLPGGDRLSVGGAGAFVNTNDFGYIWSSSADTFNAALSFGRTFSSADGSFTQAGYDPKAGVSIRCLKN
jgi:uncharacterized protein (TIGR02145 family)